MLKFLTPELRDPNKKLYVMAGKHRVRKFIVYYV